MTGSKIIYKMRTQTTIILISLIIFSSLNIPLHANKNDIQIKNLDWWVEDNVVVIKYDLLAPAHRRYNVNILLRREILHDFYIQPQNISGDVGQGAFAGENRIIRWLYLEDVPQGLKGDDYYFELIVSPVNERGVGVWLYVSAGVAVAGSATYLLLGRRNGGESRDPIPEAPGRP